MIKTEPPSQHLNYVIEAGFSESTFVYLAIIALLLLIYYNTVLLGICSTVIYFCTAAVSPGNTFGVAKKFFPKAS
jgi:hypothetical protein